MKDKQGFGMDSHFLFLGDMILLQSETLGLVL